MKNNFNVKLGFDFATKIFYKGEIEMWIGKRDLDTPFSKLILGATNSETPREFIRNSEKEFGLFKADLENISERKLNNYIENLDYLWEK